jgi:predicted ATP-dependent endonuclease of OLD family
MKWTALLNDFFESEQMLHAGALRAEKRRIYTDESVQDGFIDTLEAAYREEGRKDRVDRWVQEFGIGDYLKVDQVADTGYTIQIYEDGTARHLVDLGYGFTQLLPLILRAYQTLRVSNSPTKGRYTFLVEEPETNLHPNLQSKARRPVRRPFFPR